MESGTAARKYTCFVYTAKASTAKMKSKEAIGQPCWMPH